MPIRFVIADLFEIIDLVMENMWQIKERKLNKKAKVAKRIAA